MTIAAVPDVTPPGTGHLPAEPTPLDPRVVRAWRLARWVGLPVTLALVLVPARLLGLGWPRAIALAAGVAVVQLLVGARLDALRYRRWRWHVDDVAVVLRRGGIVQVTTTVPRFRLQHVDVSQGPIERRLGLATLVLHVAGSDAEHQLPGLDASTADHVRAALVASLAQRWAAEQRADGATTPAGTARTDDDADRAG